ncbi:NAD-dependent epimerase/dehydratase family protein [Candidatus Wolfebacteria bacterium]|nr:NAD-dependent epimerase/dehydratase family protein [Candidatus Wolfebacteria bacterium]
MTKKQKIAIFGSTSHIAKGLINNFLQSENFELHLYARSPEKLRDFLIAIKQSNNKDCVVHEGYDDFLKCSYDVVINCVGVGTANKLEGDYAKYFTITEKFDNLAIEYLRNINPNALYIGFSSGVVYGKLSAPAEENTANNIRPNHITSEDYYAIARLNAETKHRAFNNLNIVDLRLFSYFSRFIDLSDGYFITELLNSILNNKMFIIDNINIIRDYVHPNDLFSIIKKCINTKKINSAFDVISARPAEKKEILDYFSKKYGLKYEISQSLNHISTTGAKNIYYSKYDNAKIIGYKPTFSSINTIKEESKFILN